MSDKGGWADELAKLIVEDVGGVDFRFAAQTIRKHCIPISRVKRAELDSALAGEQSDDTPTTLRHFAVEDAMKKLLEAKDD